MPTCATCAGWAAVSEEQWLRRQTAIRNNPIVPPATCPKCGTSNWALTRDHITTVINSDRVPLSVWVAVVLATSVVAMALTLLLLR